MSPCLRANGWTEEWKTDTTRSQNNKDEENLRGFNPETKMEWFELLAPKCQKRTKGQKNNNSVRKEEATNKHMKVERIEDRRKEGSD